MLHYNPGQYHVSIICQLKGSVFPRALLFAVPSGLLGVLLKIIYNISSIDPEDFFGMKFSPSVFGSFTFVVGYMLVFRTSQAYSRYWEGRTLLHLMRSEWFEACSSIISFSQVSQRPRQDVIQFQHLMVRLFSLMHCGAVQLIADMKEEEFDVIDVRGLDEGSRDYLHHCQTEGHTGVYVVFQWIQGIILSHLNDGLLPIPAPILSRVFQELSNGKVHMDNALKISDTQFPFPYAQLTSVLLMLHATLTPIVVAHVCNHALVVFLFTFAPVFCFFCLNFIAIEIEQPFGEDVNDLPIADLQIEMNEGLLLLLHPRTLRLPDLSPQAVLTLNTLRNDRTTKASLNKADSIRRADKYTRNLSKIDEELDELQLSNSVDSEPESGTPSPNNSDYVFSQQERGKPSGNCAVPYHYIDADPVLRTSVPHEGEDEVSPQDRRRPTGNCATPDAKMMIAPIEPLMIPPRSDAPNGPQQMNQSELDIAVSGIISDKPTAEEWQQLQQQVRPLGKISTTMRSLKNVGPDLGT